MEDYTKLAEKVLSKITTEKDFNRAYRNLCSMLELAQIFVEEDLDRETPLSEIKAARIKVQEMFQAFADLHGLTLLPDVDIFPKKSIE